MAKELKSCGEQTNKMIELIKNHFYDCGTSHLLYKYTKMNNSLIYCGFLLSGSKVKLYSTQKSQGIIQITGRKEYKRIRQFNRSTSHMTDGHSVGDASNLYKTTCAASNTQTIWKNSQQIQNVSTILLLKNPPTFINISHCSIIPASFGQHIITAMQ